MTPSIPAARTPASQAAAAPPPAAPKSGPEIARVEQRALSKAPPSPQAPADAALSELEQLYVGTHALGVNRVSNERRCGTVSIVKGEGQLTLQGSAAQGPYNLHLAGSVEPLSAHEFVLDGELSGVPNKTWAGEPLRKREGRGRYTFVATKGRKYWRLYQVNGVDCVCDDECGNDFCYIDIDFATR